MKNMFSQVLFLNYIFHSYLLLLVSDSIQVTRNKKKQVGNAEQQKKKLVFLRSLCIL